MAAGLLPLRPRGALLAGCFCTEPYGLGVFYSIVLFQLLLFSFSPKPAWKLSFGRSASRAQAAFTLLFLRDLFEVVSALYIASGLATTSEAIGTAPPNGEVLEKSEKPDHGFRTDTRSPSPLRADRTHSLSFLRGL